MTVVSAADARAELARRELVIRQCREDPTVLMSYMSAPDEGDPEGNRISFEHCRTEQQAAQGGWGWQREVFLWMYRNPRTITLKARQIGVTWIGCAALLVDALLLPGCTCLVYRQKEADAFKNVHRCYQLLQSLPDWLRFGCVVERPDRGAEAQAELRLRFPDGNASRVLGMSSAAASGHGVTVRRALMDEHAYIDNASDLAKAIGPAVSRGFLMVVSTANGRHDPETGLGNEFHRLWVNAEQSGYRTRFLGWQVHPDRDQDWYDNSETTRELKEWQRAESYPSHANEAFKLSNRVFFEPDDLAWYGESALRKPLYRASLALESPRASRWEQSDRGALRVFVEPVVGRRYAIGADVATGRGRDYSSAHVVDLGSMQVVSEWHGRVDSDLFARDLHFLGRWYETALIAVETAGGFGEAIIAALRDRTSGRPAYPKLYRHVMSSRADLPEAKPFGFPTNVKTRPLILNGLDKALRERVLPWVSSDTLFELENFVLHDTGTSPAAANGMRDDRVMSLAIAVEMYRLRGHHPDRPERRKPRRPNKSYPWLEREELEDAEAFYATPA